jgi:4a-hydroxytetrahydrobiopterin dehydratase
MKRTRLDGRDLAGRPELADWRVLGDTLCARFAAASFTGAADFVAAVARLADDADHHPDLDLRFPGLVEIVLTTHDRNGLTEFDADLAVRISALAASSGIRAEPSGPQAPSAVVTAGDPAVVAAFWAAVLGYRARPADDDGAVLVVDPRRFHPPLRIVPAVNATTGQAATGRLHVAVALAADVVAARIEAAIAAGGRTCCTVGPHGPWELADPEDNRAVLSVTVGAG